jgi:hypothetical protein
MNTHNCKSYLGDVVPLRLLRGDTSGSNDALSEESRVVDVVLTVGAKNLAIADTLVQFNQNEKEISIASITS